MSMLPNSIYTASVTLPFKKLLLLLTVSASIQVTADSANFETVTITATRDARALGEIASSLSVISEEDLKLVTPTHINETMVRIPGVWVSRGNGQEHLTAIRSPVLTGAGSCSAFYIAEDGVPVRSNGFCNVNQLFDINTEQAYQIEVLRGPGTALHGTNALHGVINVLSKAPASSHQQHVSLEGGPHDYGRLQYSISDSRGNHGYRVSANTAHDGGFKDDSGFDQQKATLRHDFLAESIELQTLLSLSNLNQETAGYVEGKDAFKDETNQQLNPTPQAYRDSQSVRFQTKIEKQLNKTDTLIFTPYLRHTEMQFLMHFLPGTPTEENGQQSAGLQSTVIRQLTSKFILLNGFDLEFTDAYLKQTQSGGFSSFPSGKHYDYDVNALTLAYYANGDYKLSPDTTLSTGLRYESLNYDYDNNMITGNTAEDGSICINSFTNAVGCRYSRPEDRSDHFDNGALTAGLVHTISEQLSLVSRATHGFRAPQASELYRLQVNQLQADLDSVEIDSLEAGIRANFETLHFSLTGFYMKKNNVIFQASDRRNLDDGKTRHIGIEYQFTWFLNDQFNLTSSGSFARHQYIKDVSLFGSSTSISIKGNDIDTAPRHMGSTQFGWKINDKSRVELEWVHMGKYYTDIDNLHTYEGHELFNLRTKHKINQHAVVGIRITNLTDEKYAERADFSSFSGDRYFIGEPRSVYLEMSLTF